MFTFTATRPPARLLSHFSAANYGPGQVMFQRALRTLTTAAVLIILGSLLVALNHWAGVGQGRVLWLGPVLCLVAVIMVLLAFRYFIIAKRLSQGAQTQIRLQVIVENGVSALNQRLRQEEPPDYTSVIMDTHLDPHCPPSYPNTPPPSYRQNSNTPERQQKPQDPPPTYYEAVFHAARDTQV